MSRMETYQSKASTLPGTSYDETLRLVRHEQKKIENLTKRQPYVRSTYFSNDKVFIACFMNHAMQKSRKERTERFKLYNAAIDLLRNTRHEPETILKKDLPGVVLFRFYGVTKDGQKFCVQVKQENRTGRKDFMSAFLKKNIP